MKLAIAAVVIVMATSANSATIDGTWSTIDGCNRLAAMKINPDAAWDGNFEEMSYLSEQGILGYEWGCDFLDSHTNQYGLTVHVSTCSYGPESWPDLMMTKYSDDTGWTVVVTEADAIKEEYYPVKCDN